MVTRGAVVTGTRAATAGPPAPGGQDTEQPNPEPGATRARARSDTRVVVTLGPGDRGNKYILRHQDPSVISHYRCRFDANWD